MNIDEDKKDCQLLLMISENDLKVIIEDSFRKIMLELSTKEDPPDEFLTSKQVCKLLKISLSTINNWRSSGKLKAHKLGNRILFRREEILTKIAELRPFRSVEDSVN